MPLGAILRASVLFYLHIGIARAFPVFLHPKTEKPYMYQPNPGDLNLSTQFKLPTYHPDRLCHILLGDYAAVVEAINRRSVLRYCQHIAWVGLIPTRRNGEYISVMTRRITPSE
jgi:hypothetical protein